MSDLRTLSFIAIEERLAPELQADVAKKASATPNVYVAAPIDAKLQDACVLSEIRTRQMRLLYAILERWPKVDPNRLEPAARYAIAALFFGDSLPPATRDAALAVFDTNVEQIDNLIDARQTVATHQPSQQTCESVEPKTTYAVSPPTYPEEARLKRETGIVSVKRTLDSHGFVAAAQLFASSMKPKDDYGLIPTAILSAATSDYLPGRSQCHTIGGSYVFRVDFAAR